MRAMAASGAGGEGDEGITLLQPYGLPLVHRSLYCRVLPLGLSLEELFLPGWVMGRGSRVAAGSDYLDFKKGTINKIKGARTTSRVNDSNKDRSL